MNAAFPIPAHSLLQIALILAMAIIAVPVVGGFMARVFAGQRTALHVVLFPIEKLALRLLGGAANSEMHWKRYALCVLALGAGSFVALYALLRFQAVLPLNPQAFANLAPDLAFNVAASFITNTNWQSYSGESALSYFTQTVGLMVQQFVAPAVGLAVLVAFVRGLTTPRAETIGNFWVDMVRALLYVLLPLSFIAAVVMAGAGVVQNAAPYLLVETLDPAVAPQTIPGGLVASFESIKMLGTNGGGFFNANSAHPFENPTPFTNVLQLWLMLLIPFAACYMYGVMANDRRQGWAVLAAMLVMLVLMLAVPLWVEHQGNPKLVALGADVAASPLAAGGNMEGKEARFGISTSVLWSVATTGTSTGAVNSAHEAFLPLSQMCQMLLMQFGEVAPGGVGSGLYGMLIYVMLAVFLAGLMVGRTPELLGKKIGVFEMKVVALIILIPVMCILIGTGAALMLPQARAAMLGSGPQGLGEVLYAFSSAANNNGSALAGLSANQPFYNYALGVCMLVGRYWLMVLMLALAGSMGIKQPVPQSAGTLPTHTPLFVTLLLFAMALLTVLNFVPALALGPVVEHLILWGGTP